MKNVLKAIKSFCYENYENFGLIIMAFIAALLVVVFITDIIYYNKQSENPITDSNYEYMKIITQAEEYHQSATNLFIYINENKMRRRNEERLMNLAQSLEKRANEYYLKADSINKILPKLED